MPHCALHYLSTLQCSAPPFFRILLTYWVSKTNTAMKIFQLLIFYRIWTLFQFSHYVVNLFCSAVCDHSLVLNSLFQCEDRLYEEGKSNTTSGINLERHNIPFLAAATILRFRNRNRLELLKENFKFLKGKGLQSYGPLKFEIFCSFVRSSGKSDDLWVLWLFAEL